MLAEFEREFVDPPFHVLKEETDERELNYWQPGFGSWFNSGLKVLGEATLDV